MSLEFTPFPKIPRLTGGMVITEKLDGTNAAIVVTEEGEVLAQSRTRFITPDSDNYGFAAWVYEKDHPEELAATLGPGVHFGEWWGEGIQRGYGVKGKRFSLFNTGRWTTPLNIEALGGGFAWPSPEVGPDGYTCIEAPLCHVVPVLYAGAFDTNHAKLLYEELRETGSHAAPGFANPEGIIIWDTLGRNTYKLNDAKQGAKHGKTEGVSN